MGHADAHPPQPPPPQTVTIDQAIQIARGHQFHRRLAEAEAVLRQVVAAAPGRVDALNELAMAIGERGKLDEADEILRRAVAVSPGYLPAWHNLAVAAERRGDYATAVASLRRAVEIAPAHADTRYRLALALKRAGAFDEALRESRIAVDLDPKEPEARGLLANLLLLHGDFARGWDEYEVRWRCPSFPDERRPWSDLKLARDDVRGKRVVVHGEQGFGDTIMFSRYLRLLTERGADVTAVVPSELVGVVSWQPGAARVTSAKNVTGDFHVPMMSLPRAFGTTPDTIPADVPYIVPPHDLVEKWRQKLAGHKGLKVGIAWAGRPEHKQDRERTVRLERFAGIASLPGVTLFTLQKGPAAAQANPPPAGMKVVNLTAGLADFADTAGLIANLDLVLAVDTAVVHLAGAMAKPVWTLLAAVPDFRWMLARDDSPWYPTMRLFRQTKVGEWADVFDRVEAELRRRMKAEG